MADRTPEQRQLDARTERSLRRVLDDALDDYTSWLVAEQLRMDAATCERWIDALYDNLRERLDPEQRLQAVVLLLADEAHKRAAHVTREVPR